MKEDPGWRGRQGVGLRQEEDKTPTSPSRLTVSPPHLNCAGGPGPALAWGCREDLSSESPLGTAEGVRVTPTPPECNVRTRSVVMAKPEAGHDVSPSAPPARPCLSPLPPALSHQLTAVPSLLGNPPEGHTPAGSGGQSRRAWEGNDPPWLRPDTALGLGCSANGLRGEIPTSPDKAADPS